MSSAFEITVVLIVSLVAFYFFKKARNKSSSIEAPSGNAEKIAKQEQAEPKAADQAVANEATSTTVNPQITDAVTTPQPETTPPPAADIQPAVEEPKNQAAPAEKANNLPQDSVLRRHYLTHLYTLAESLYPARPVDSVLRRHFDTMITNRIDDCLNDNNALEKLISDYEKNK